LKARSQPMGTLLPASSSDGFDLGPFLAGAGTLGSRSPLSARSTTCNFDTTPSVLGKEGKEIRTIEQSAVASTARRSTVLRIKPSHPGELDQKTIRNCSSFLRMALYKCIGLGIWELVFVERVMPTRSLNRRAAVLSLFFLVD